MPTESVLIENPGLLEIMDSVEKLDTTATTLLEPNKLESSSSSLLQKKLKKVLDIKLDQDNDLLEALQALSATYTENTLKNRRKLRGDLERRALHVNQDFIDGYGLVKCRLDKVQSEVDAMAKSCQEMSENLEAAKRETSGVIAKTNKLADSRQSFDVKHKLASAFLKRFQLSDEQYVLLTGHPILGRYGSTMSATSRRTSVVSQDALSRKGSSHQDASRQNSEAYSSRKNSIESIARSTSPTQNVMAKRSSSSQVLLKGDMSESVDKFNTEGEPLTDEFFEVLDRCRTIHADSQNLLLSEHQVIGLEIMNSMALVQETAYERLYRWSLKQCRGLGRDMPDVSPILRKSLFELKLHRLQLFKYCIEEIVNTRKSTVMRQFIDALALGPRPIEMHAHEPFRYCSDMLAWIHQAIAAEQELLVTLFTLPPSPADAAKHHQQRRAKKAKGENIEIINDSEKVMTINDLLTEIMSGCSKPFKARLDQVLLSQPGIIMCSRLVNLLLFYVETVKPLIDKSESIAETIEEGRVLALKVFHDSLTEHTNKLISNSVAVSENLAPSRPILETIDILTAIVRLYNESFIVLAVPLDGEASKEIDTDSIQAILTDILDPTLQSAQIAASGLSPTNLAVYLLNCLTLIQGILGQYDFCNVHLNKVKEQMTNHITNLVNSQASYVLSKTGLATILQSLTTYQSESGDVGPMSSYPGLEPDTIRNTMKQFDMFLSFSSHEITMPQCALISSSRLRMKIREEAKILVIRAYASLYTAVMQLDNNYPDPASIMRRSTEQLKTLLI